MKKRYDLLGFNLIYDNKENKIFIIDNTKEYFEWVFKNEDKINKHF